MTLYRFTPPQPEQLGHCNRPSHSRNNKLCGLVLIRFLWEFLWAWGLQARQHSHCECQTFWDLKLAIEMSASYSFAVQNYGLPLADISVKQERHCNSSLCFCYLTWFHAAFQANKLLQHHLTCPPHAEDLPFAGTSIPTQYNRLLSECRWTRYSCQRVSIRVNIPIL